MAAPRLCDDAPLQQLGDRRDTCNNGVILSCPPKVGMPSSAGVRQRVRTMATCLARGCREAADGRTILPADGHRNARGRPGDT